MKTIIVDDERWAREQMEDELTTVTALLHDVVEDSPYTLTDLREMGFKDLLRIG